MQMWNEIKSDEDIEYFKHQTGCMHDAVIVSIEYITGCDVTEDRSTVISIDENRYGVRIVVGSCWFGKLEMLFDGVKYLSTGSSGDMWECYLGFRKDLLGRTRDDRLIVWTDTGIFDPEIHGTKIGLGSIDLRRPLDTCVIAYDMKWRFINESEAK